MYTNILLLCISGFLIFTSAAEPKIVGGENAPDLSYQLALEWFGWQFCGGVLISNKYALTAAHCVLDYKPYQITIRAGSTIKEDGGETLKVKNISIPKGFEHDHMDYDVAVLELEEPLEFGPGIQPISISDTEPTPGELATVSGWGSLKENGEYATVLQYVNIPIVDRKECKSAYGGAIEPIGDRQLCAGELDKGTCHHDSGGPLVWNNKLVGVVSWGRGCGDGVHPGVFANLVSPDLRGFIREVTNI